MENSKEVWTRTFTGKKFFPLAPTQSDICLDDIAHSLSMICRYNGHCKHYYSVAQHSVNVTNIVGNTLIGKHWSITDRLSTYEPEQLNMLRWALLHDASEAYLGDVVSPLKMTLSVGNAGFGFAEHSVMTEVCQYFGLVGEEPQLVKMADLMALKREAMDLMGAPDDWNLEDIEDAPERAVHTDMVTPTVARDNFKFYAHKLGLTDENE